MFQVVKLGGSIIDSGLDIDFLYRELTRYMHEQNTVLAIFTGGGVAHDLVKEYRAGLLEDLMEVHEYVKNLNNRIITKFRDLNQEIDVYNPIDVCRIENDRINMDYLLELMKSSLENGKMASTYGDIVLHEKDLPNKGFEILSADDSSAGLAKKIKASQLIHVVDVLGVLRDPNDPSSLISYIDPREKLDVQFKSVSGDVTGAMRKKVEVAIQVALTGIPVRIIGAEPGNLYKALNGIHVGTKIALER